MPRFLLPLLFALLPLAIPAAPPDAVTFASRDQLAVRADVYAPHPPTAPFILLCHRARSSRGEYAEIAPRLNELGYNCMAIDQRSGAAIAGVVNETAKLARAQGKPTAYMAAEQDIDAAIDYARARYVKGKFLLMGSSYSSTLAIKFGAESPARIDGVIAFAPGEYFESQGGTRTTFSDSARKLNCPVFVTSSKVEAKQWRPAYDTIPAASKSMFVPETDGAHGAEALWKSIPEHAGYWKALEAFLAKNFPPKAKSAP